MAEVFLAFSIAILIGEILVIFRWHYRQKRRERVCLGHEKAIHYYDGPPYGMGQYGQICCVHCGKSFSEARILNWRGAGGEARDYLQQQYRGCSGGEGRTDA